MFFWLTIFEMQKKERDDININKNKDYEQSHMVENMFWVIIIIVMLRSGRRIGAVSGELYCYGCYV